jgi:hypothetical protein
VKASSEVVLIVLVGTFAGGYVGEKYNLNDRQHLSHTSAHSCNWSNGVIKKQQQQQQSIYLG